MTKKPSVKSSLPVPNQATPPSLPSRAPEPTVDRIEELAGRILRGDDALFHGNTKEFHHFFPRDYLKSKGIATRKANVLANFVMLTAASNKRITNRAPSDYLKEVKKELGANLDHLGNQLNFSRGI